MNAHPFKNAFAGATLCAVCGQIPQHRDHAQPEYQPGDVAIATVHDEDGAEPGQLVVRRGGSLGGWSWPARGQVLFDHEVIVTSRAVVVTRADLRQLGDLSANRAHFKPVSQVYDEWFAALLGGG